MARFKHGTKTDSKNYLSISAGPLRGKRVHILVAEAMLGRKLHRDETVHHRDLNMLNCCWSNLKVMNRSDHGAVSNRQRWFLKNRELAELLWWREWIEVGGDRPDLAGDAGVAESDIGSESDSATTATTAASAAAAAAAIEFKPEDFNDHD